MYGRLTITNEDNSKNKYKKKKFDKNIFKLKYIKKKLKKNRGSMLEWDDENKTNSANVQSVLVLKNTIRMKLKKKT